MRRVLLDFRCDFADELKLRLAAHQRIRTRVFTLVFLLFSKNFAIIYIESERKELKAMKNFKELQSKFTGVLDYLVEEYNFELFLDSGDRGDFYCWRDGYTDGYCLEDMTFYCGATKVVIVFDEEDYVLKIPFSSENIDYCYEEFRNYVEAKRYGLEEYFAACYKLMNYHDTPIYIMERCDCDDEKTGETIAEALSPLREKNYDLDDEEGYYDFTCEVYDDEESVMEFLTYTFGEKESTRLFAFCSRNEINDLHAGNIGWIGDRLVLTDYSGYGDIEGPYEQDDWWDNVEIFEEEMKSWD